MGVTAGDFDGPGNESILATNLTREGAALYRNNGRGEFDDATTIFGTSRTDSLAAWQRRNPRRLPGAGQGRSCLQTPVRTRIPA